MTITISPGLEAQLREKAAAEDLSVDAYIERLIREDQTWGEFQEDSTDSPGFRELEGAVTEGLEQAERGEGIPLREFDQAMRAKHGIHR